MSFQEEQKVINIYASLFDPAVTKNDAFWDQLLLTKYHYFALSSKFSSMTIGQVRQQAPLLEAIFLKGLDRLEKGIEVNNIINILRILVKDIFLRLKKIDALVTVMGNVAHASDCMGRFLAVILLLLKAEGTDKEKLAELYLTLVKTFRGTFCFSLLYDYNAKEPLLEMFSQCEVPSVGDLMTIFCLLINDSSISWNDFKKLSKVPQEATQAINQCFMMADEFYFDQRPDLAKPVSTLASWIPFWNEKEDPVPLREDFMELLEKKQRITKGEEITPLLEIVPAMMLFYSFLLYGQGYHNDDLSYFFSASSYVLQYQHKIEPHRLASRLSLLCLNLLVDGGLPEGEMSGRLCHQKQPIIRSVFQDEEEEEEGEKPKQRSAVHFALDMVQYQYRFNLTKKMEVINFKLANVIVFKILSITKEFGHYNWTDFWRSFLGFIAFLRTYENVTMSVENSARLACVMQECISIIDLALNSADTCMVQQLMYAVMEKDGILKRVMQLFHIKLEKFSQLLNVLTFTAENVSDHMEKREAMQMIHAFINEREPVPCHHRENFTYLETKIYSNGKITLSNTLLDYLQDRQMFR